MLHQNKQKRLVGGIKDFVRLTAGKLQINYAAMTVVTGGQERRTDKKNLYLNISLTFQMIASVTEMLPPVYTRIVIDWVIHFLLLCKCNCIRRSGGITSTHGSRSLWSDPNDRHRVGRGVSERCCMQLSR